MSVSESDVTWVNLKILAKLEPFQKLNTKATHFSLHKTTAYLPEFVARWWAGASRDSDYIRLKELYAAAEKMLTDSNERERMLEHMRSSTNGLRALQKTYEGDATTLAKIDWLLDSVNMNIEKYAQADEIFP